jgi:hypothetical protein
MFPILCRMFRMCRIEFGVKSEKHQTPNLRLNSSFLIKRQTTSPLTVLRTRLPRRPGQPGPAGNGEDTI